MPSKKGKKTGGCGSDKKPEIAKSSKPGVAQGGSSTTARSGSTAVPQQVSESAIVAPKQATHDPLLVQASSIHESDTQPAKTSSDSDIVNLSSEQTAGVAPPAMSAKGKERANALPPMPKMSVPVLASRLRLFKARAGLIENSTSSKSCPGVHLNLASADEDLKDRARRMKSIQQRTSAEYPDAVSTKQSTQSFLEMLLAAEVAKHLCRSYADTMYAEDDFFFTNYLWGNEPMWSVDEEHETTSDERGLEEHESRWQGLTAALRQKPEYQRLRTAVDEDFLKVGMLLQEAKVKTAIDRIFKHTEYAQFRQGDSGGLIVHAYDAGYREKSKNQTRGLRKIWKGRLRDSVVSGFPHRFLTEFKGPGIAMMHVAGYANTFRPQEHALTGWRGLFRSLCNQLVAQRPYMKGLKLARLTNDMLEELMKPRAAMETMFSLFRDLILDVAEMGVRRRWPAQEVVVIIDGIDWFEDRSDDPVLPTFDAHALVQEYKKVVRENGNQSDLATLHWSNMSPTEQKVVQDWLDAEAKGDKSETEKLQAGKVDPQVKSDMGWERVIGFFRNLADECNNSELGKMVRFKYILLHPLSSKIGANPSVLERYITLNEEP